MQVDDMKSKIDRCCCTCGRNIRVQDENGMVTRCECAIDGHYIGYVASFEHSCRRYVLDKAYKPGGKWYNPDNFEQKQESEKEKSKNIPVNIVVTDIKKVYIKY